MVRTFNLEPHWPGVVNYLRHIEKTDPKQFNKLIAFIGEDEWKKIQRLGDMKDPRDKPPFIHLSNAEQSGSAECGCVLQYTDGEPALYQCNLHENAEQIHQKLSLLFIHWRRTKTSDNFPELNGSVQRLLDLIQPSNKRVVSFEELFGDGDLDEVTERVKGALNEQLWHESQGNLDLNDVEEHYDYEIVRQVIITPKGE